MSGSLPLLIITGPTGTGKSRLALHLAQKWNGEIISADSRQIYRYMDIGTSKPNAEERAMIPHHMIDIVDPDQFYSAGEYGRNARSIIDNLLKKKRLPILVGGTGLYIRVVLDGLAPSPPSDPHIKADLLEQIRKKGIRILHNKLLEIDPKAAKRLHPNDRQRILRAMEVFLITGKRLSDFHRQTIDHPKYITALFFINRPRAILYNMIDQRVESMFEQGLIKEAKGLMERGYTLNHPGLQSLGYGHIYEYIQKKISLQEAKSFMKRDTRRYAKRQITWFRQEKRAIWLDMSDKSDVLDLAPQIDLNLRSPK
ncbi:MAG: tRNA (adenosine(37)-N6)-dimethylallyltransferase MiaA [bacterium]